MSISQNYYLRRAFEIECIARQLPASKERTGLEDIAEAYRMLASCAAQKNTVVRHADEVEFRADELLAAHREQTSQ